jgi:hypothetical protein
MHSFCVPATIGMKLAVKLLIQYSAKPLEIYKHATRKIV